VTVFHTTAYGELGHLRRPTNVAFEADQVDTAAGTAWSVVVQSRAEAVALPQELTACGPARHRAVGARNRNPFIAITAHALSGRIAHAPSVT
jgi:hypothetical protein